MSTAGGQFCCIRLFRNLVPFHLVALLFAKVVSLRDSSFTAQPSVLDTEKNAEKKWRISSFLKVRRFGIKLFISYCIPNNLLTWSYHLQEKLETLVSVWVITCFAIWTTPCVIIEVLITKRKKRDCIFEVKISVKVAYSSILDR